ncbi:hypothetical protein QQ045_011385 [Rhodiola kirilowii]
MRRLDSIGSPFSAVAQPSNMGPAAVASISWGEVSEWMNEKGICIFSTAEHAVQLDLIGKVHGYEAAERELIEKQACKRYLNRDYMNMLKSLVRLGALEEAEEVLKDWDSSSNYYDTRLTQLVIDGYSEKGLVEKAKSLIDDLQKKGKEGPQTV